MGALLIFPAVSAESWEYARLARREGRSVLLAGSMSIAPPGLKLEQGQRWFELPGIYASEFVEVLSDLVDEFEVNAIYSPVPAVHAFLKRHLPNLERPVCLVNDAPIERQVRLLRDMESMIADLRAVERGASDGAKGLDDIELRTVVDTAISIYGESGPVKIAAMAGVMAASPRGDIVEIGSLMGRSAAALRLLARRFDIGSVLTIDPWARINSIQLDSPQALREDMVDQWDYELLARAFTAYMLSLGDSDFAHLRMPSKQGYEYYLAHKTIQFGPFKPANFAGSIAVLHIDGNHDYSAVVEDWECWGRHLVAGSWLILDDYVWAHGDGPQRLGNELLEAYRDCIERCFVLDKAMFVRFSKTPINTESLS